MSLRIGVVCHASLGGSGVIASELAQGLARAGHELHVFAAAPPPRLDVATPNLTLHRVVTPTSPLLPAGEYALALASTLAKVSTEARLDVLHLHYAIPHAVSALLARGMLGTARPRLVVTVHGTDVLTLGLEPALEPVLRYALRSVDAVTAPTRFLSAHAHAAFGLPQAPDVVGNFVDGARFSPKPHSSRAEKVLVHDSNFRPLKRVDDVVRVFAKVRAALPARLVLVGDGPGRPQAEALARELGVADGVDFRGVQRDVAPALHEADVFLLPSETESFGLAALEALACGVPVVATRVGGLPELVEDGVTGALLPVGDVDGMAAKVLALLTDDGAWQRASVAARKAALTKWTPRAALDAYEAVYRRVLGRGV